MKSGLAAVGFGLVVTHLATSNMPLYTYQRPKLSGEFAQKIKRELELESQKNSIICDDVFGIVRKAGTIYLSNNQHYYNDPAYMNLHEALFRIQSYNWDHYQNTDVPIDIIDTPGYYLYNEFGFRVKKPSAVGKRAHIKGLINDFLEHSF